MDGHLDFRLPGRTREPHGPGMWLVIFAGIAFAVVLVGIVIGMLHSPRGAASASGTILSPEPQKALALKLEKQGFPMLAIKAWKEYLVFTSRDKTDSAKIWYRIGVLYQDAGDKSSALDAYYRSESLADLKELSGEIDRRTQECLDGLGKLSALHYELAGRVGLETNAAAHGNRVVAELGPEKITLADLDRRIEQELDIQLKQFQYLPEEEYLKRKENFLRKYASPAEKSRMLEQILGEEILYRSAAEQRLGESPDAAALLRNVEHGIMARLAMEKEMKDNIRITAGDLRTWYDANAAQYVEPEKARVSVARMKDRKAADEMLLRAGKGGKIEDIVREFQAGKTNAALSEGWMAKGGFAPGIGKSVEAEEAVFTSATGQVCKAVISAGDDFYVIKVADKTPERRLGFDEVKDRVAQDLYARKSMEVQSDLMRRLKDQYNVVIHADALGVGAKE